MNIIKKLISIIKSIFNHQRVKLLDSAKEDKILGQSKQDTISSYHKENIISSQAKQDIEKAPRNDFIKSLKENISTDKAEKIKIETLICEGDGLGIQRKISY